MANLILMVVGTVIVFLVILLLFPSGSKNDISGRLASLDDPDGTQQIASATESELNKPFVDRVIRPMIAKLAGKSEDNKDAKAKKKAKSGLKKMLAQAGFPGGLTVAEFAVIQNLFKAFCPLIGLAIGFVIKPNLALMGLAAGAIIGMMAPKMYLQKKIAQRQHDIQKGLPDVLDLLTVAVEAGLGFDAACDKVVEKMRGPIPNEFSLTLKQMRMGEARRDAFKSMSERVDNPDFNAFVSAIIQADQLGVSIGQVLRIQSEQLREKRRQRAEEESAKAPVKMMIPLIFFIFPNVMLVIGAPAAFQMIEGFSGMQQ
ncbi:MAG: type II secretion system F family protein [Candidatus Riflebacteria bacterium]|nr:type II secretion system F family protein [Candidatus Riflebacteria bacterium]